MDQPACLAWQRAAPDVGWMMTITSARVQDHTTMIPIHHPLPPTPRLPRQPCPSDQARAHLAEACELVGPGGPSPSTADEQDVVLELGNLWYNRYLLCESEVGRLRGGSRAVIFRGVYSLTRPPRQRWRYLPRTLRGMPPPPQGCHVFSQGTAVPVALPVASPSCRDGEVPNEQPRKARWGNYACFVAAGDGSWSPPDLLTQPRAPASALDSSVIPRPTCVPWTRMPSWPLIGVRARVHLST